MEVGTCDISWVVHYYSESSVLEDLKLINVGCGCTTPDLAGVGDGKVNCGGPLVGSRRDCGGFCGEGQEISTASYEVEKFVSTIVIFPAMRTPCSINGVEVSHDEAVSSISKDPLEVCDEVLGWRARRSVDAADGEFVASFDDYGCVFNGGGADIDAVVGY
ncbi:hypothetical protein TNIN_76141 [Trichonephila inaurata madagascariensis]|uniref:Uncharacterized protein n=1 Tax=Trichonephila inaurata madagascariensis TaxID=2747483 RepID=A0A8X6XF55_9ARAC|nr:hypothetical protein TNIN_76141 [Trichonephila inaurata madagascariensis]